MADRPPKPDGILEPDGIPELLVDHDVWICWDFIWKADREEWAKVPHDPRTGEPGADPTDEDTWADFETALETARDEGFGLGYCFDEGGLIVGIDLDDCRDPDTGELDGWAAEWVDRFDSFAQVSTSGTGLHVFAVGIKPGDRCRTGDVTEGDGTDVEMYGNKRFFAMTGAHLEGTPGTVEKRADVVKAAYAAWFEDDVDEDQASLTADYGGGDPADLDDRELLDRARNAKNGDKFEALWGGSTAGYESQSEADLALCSLLAFWTGGDEARMDRLFRRSGLMRPKWDEDRGERTYGERTIDTALEGATEFYEPRDTVELEGVEPPNVDADDVVDDEEPPDGTGAGAGDGDGEDGEDPEPPPEARSGLSSWDTIRSKYRQALESSQGDTTAIRQRARFVATRRLEEVEAHFATNEVSDHLFVYDPDEGIYVERGEAYVHERLEDELCETYTTKEKTEIVDRIKGRTYHHPDEFGGPPGYIPVNNGILEVGRDGVVQRIDHTPEYLFMSKLEADYDPDAECPVWREQLLETAVGREEDLETLQEYVGYTLMSWALPYHKALFLAGPQASGKSTFLDGVRALLGPSATSSIAPQELVGDRRFTAIKLWESWANIRNDISSKVMRDAGKFKEIVAGDPIYVEDKNEKGFEIEPNAKHLYSANTLPDIEEDDDAFFRRILLVSFPHTVPVRDRDPFLDDKIEAEVSGILNWALEGLERLMDQGRFTGDEHPEEIRQRWEEWGDSPSRFKNECLVKEPDTFVPKKRAHTAFKAFCEQYNLPSTSQRKLTTELKKDQAISDGHRTPEGASRQVRAFTGVRLKDEWAERVDALEGGGDDDNDDDDPPRHQGLDKF